MKTVPLSIYTFQQATVNQYEPKSYFNYMHPKK